MKSVKFFSVSVFNFLCFISFTVKGQTSSYQLVWSDEFNYEGLPDTTVWSYETGGGGWGNSQSQYYTSERLENARVENGNLIIEAKEESYKSYNYTSARLITYYTENYWKYGKIEAKIKAPYGQGIWPAFWMEGKNKFEGDGWPYCGEIDIMEMIGGGEGYDDVNYGTAHWADADGNHAYSSGSIQLNSGILADTFHIYSVEWDKNSIKWFLDGEQYHTLDITPSDLSEFHNKFFIILNVAVGGNWPGYPDGTTTFPQKMKVDYVRVYQTTAQSDVSSTLESSRIEVYPTLSSHQIFIKNLSSKYNYKIFSLTGKLVKKGIISSSNNKITIDELINGLYIILIKNENNFFSGKFIKNYME